MEMEMEKQQEFEWNEAQKIKISVDLVSAAKRQLDFLAAVDRNRWLYQEGPALQWAIYRYNACWLPLLAKHIESQICEGPLVVPLDCEWIWHCHRLNPVQYKKDCEELYGRILDNSNVISCIQASCKRQTEEIWTRLFPEESYDFDMTRAFAEDASRKLSGLEKYTKYDLVSAVRRQGPFYYQVSRPQMNNDIFLQEALERYKGFLHLIKRNKERSVRRFCVPTYDVDLIWHTHQLHPAAYCKDLDEALGKMLEHDDMDSDRTKGKKLDVGFSGTTKQWEETFGRRYWKAGAMYRGSAPSPLTAIPPSSNIKSSEVVASNETQKTIQFPEVKVVEVLLEAVEVKNLPDRHKGSLFFSFSKTQPDKIFNVKRKLTILSESGEKQVASFQCEPTGELLFELVSHSPSNLPVTRAPKTMGTTSISLQEFLAPVSKLTVEKWFELVPSSGNASSKPISLRIAVSFTVPTAAPHVFHMVRSWPLSKSSCFFPLPGRVQQAKSRTRVIDESHTEVMNLQMRDSSQAKPRDDHTSTKQVIGITKSDGAHTLAEFIGSRWSLMYSHGCLQLQTKSSEDGYLLELSGSRTVKIFPGRKLDYEPKQWEKQRSEQDFMTLVEFSAEFPYGKAVALLDLKSEYFKVKEEWFVVPGITLAFILFDMWKKRGCTGFIDDEEISEVDGITEKVNGFHEEGKQNNLTSGESKAELKVGVATGNALMLEKARSNSGGCGGGCGSGCGNVVWSEAGSGCGSGCGGGCGNMVKSGGCGSGCGGGCGNMVNSGGCGSGCGSGCGNMVKSGGCGSGCGGNCGNIMKSSGCGGCGGGSETLANSVENDGCEIADHASNACINEYSKEIPTYVNGAIIA